MRGTVLSGCDNGRSDAVLLEGIDRDKTSVMINEFKDN